MIKHFKTSTLKDYMSLAGELGMLEGKSRTDNVLAELWKQHGADTCVVYEEKLDGEVSWGVTNYNTALSEGKVVTVYTTDDVLPNDLNKADKLDEYADNLRELKEDLVNHPLHYNQYSQEVIDTIEEVTANMPISVAYHVGNAIKYLFRAPFKGKMKQDIEKAVWYLERALTKL